MEEVTGWYSADIRKEVYDDVKLGQLSQRFIAWKENRCGKVKIDLPPVDDGLMSYSIKKIFFERQEDLVDYVLSFEEIPRITEVAAFYAPYVPLTTYGTGNVGIFRPNTPSFNTRYYSVNSTSNTDSDI